MKDSIRIPTIKRLLKQQLLLGGLQGADGVKVNLPEDNGSAAHTDSVFAAYGEEFGLSACFYILLFFFGLIYFSFQVTAVAKDQFGRLLSAGITTYLAMHMIVNMGMMCGFLPITGVPLTLITYGGILCPVDNDRFRDITKYL